MSRAISPRRAALASIARQLERCRDQVQTLEKAAYKNGEYELAVSLTEGHVRLEKALVNINFVRERS